MGILASMIKLTVFYPYTDGAKFDMEYYRDRHMPMVQQRLGAACKGIAVEQGLSAGNPGSRPQFIAMGHVYLDSMEDFEVTFSKHVNEFVADVPNYTNIEPLIQISEVVAAHEPVAASEHA
jgi:uncharacterized protein (TIGR02118 family)